MSLPGYIGSVEVGTSAGYSTTTGYPIPPAETFELGVLKCDFVEKPSSAPTTNTGNAWRRNAGVRIAGVGYFSSIQVLNRCDISIEADYDGGMPGDPWSFSANDLIYLEIIAGRGLIGLCQIDELHHGLEVSETGKISVSLKCHTVGPYLIDLTP